MGQPRRTADEMYPLVEQYEERAQTAVAFCAEHGISYAQLLYWRQKYRRDAADGGSFVEIGRPAAGDAAQVEICLPWRDARTLLCAGLRVVPGAAGAVMIGPGPSHRYYFYRPPADMRKSFDGLCALVKSGMKRDPMSGDVFFFVNRRRSHLKALVWERNGFALFYKRLGSGHDSSCRRRTSLRGRRW